MQIEVLSIHRGHELLWNAQQILLETCRKQISAELRTADIFISSMWYLYCVLKHCIFFVTYACASPEPVISRISAILRSFGRLCGTYCYEIQRDTVTKTRHRSIAIQCWHSQRINFRKGSGFKHTLIAPYHSRSTKRNVLFKPLSNILRQRETTQLRKV